MQAAVILSYQEPPHVEQFPEPTPRDGEVLVHVLAAALNPSTRAMASGDHYARPAGLPTICGVDGVGRLDDGRRVFFGGPRPPYGSFSSLTVVSRPRAWEIPDGLDDVTAAALPNAALSSWLPLVSTAGFKPGDSVLVLGATGIAGKLAVQIARLLGAGRIVAAGRNSKILEKLPALGADATIKLDDSGGDAGEAFVREAGDSGYQVILDYLWGEPTHTLVSALESAEIRYDMGGPRLVQIGNSAGPIARLAAQSIRSANLTIVGGGFPPPEVFVSTFRQLMESAAAGKITVDTEAVPLVQFPTAWNRGDQDGRRIVIVP
jgi:NADPH:quinone reductase-like Zn-dependent oxidoreductase